MRLSGCDMDSDYEPVAVANQMDLRAKAASRTPQRMVKWFLHLRHLGPPSCLELLLFFFAPAAARLARMTEASIHHRS